MKEWIEVARNMIEWIETHPDCGRVLDGLRRTRQFIDTLSSVEKVEVLPL